MAMGHGSWVTWVMGQLCDGHMGHGSRKMTNFHLCHKILTVMSLSRYGINT